MRRFVKGMVISNTDWFTGGSTTRRVINRTENKVWFKVDSEECDGHYERVESFSIRRDEAGNEDVLLFTYHDSECCVTPVDVDTYRAYKLVDQSGKVLREGATSDPDMARYDAEWYERVLNKSISVEWGELVYGEPEEYRIICFDSCYDYTVTNVCYDKLNKASAKRIYDRLLEPISLASCGSIDFTIQKMVAGAEDRAPYPWEDVVMEWGNKACQYDPEVLFC